ncbi:hypothetical protein [Streptomyces sp. NPDC021622]|uniref:hypothetical protein n=1 Tax=Streptomyces sp. NPDC021622 TaxID=3155013 RepID=UPI0033DFF508
MRTLASPAAIDVTAARYLKALEKAHSPGEAAAKAGTALVHDWANAVLETRDRLGEQTPTEESEASE